MLKWSSIRNGLKFLSFGVPIDLRTLAPTPSDCSMARKAFRMARGTDMFGDCVREGSCGGTTGRPGKFAVCCWVFAVVSDIGDIVVVMRLVANVLRCGTIRSR